MWLLLLLAARAGEALDDFSTDAGAWQGGELAEGALRVSGGEARLALGEVATLEGRLRLRQVDAGRLSLSVGEATLTLDYVDDGGVAMGGQALPLPPGHRAWQTEAEPALAASLDLQQSWEVGGVLHAEILRHGDTWYLFYTGVEAPGYGYRRIGVATSPDGLTWTRHAGNPVITLGDDLSDVDGVHVHMPTVVIDPSDGLWHMFYACYQDGVGNRVCHASSADGLSWQPLGVALDRGVSGEFDSASLREPDVLIDDDGVWHMLYQGTQGSEHYGPTGYATSRDGHTWSKHGALDGTGPDLLQGGGVLAGPYGLEQWYNCADALCAARSPHEVWTLWDLDPEPELVKGWASWNEGYLQGATPWLHGQTLHLWFNAYDPRTVLESIGHAASVPAPGAWLDLELRLAEGALEVEVDGGPSLSVAAAGVRTLTFASSGVAELDEVELVWEAPPLDTAPPADSAADSGGPAPDPEGCGCGGAGSPGGAGLLVAAAAVGARRRRRA